MRWRGPPVPPPPAPRDGLARRAFGAIWRGVALFAGWGLFMLANWSLVEWARVQAGL